MGDIQVVEGMLDEEIEREEHERNAVREMAQKAELERMENYDELMHAFNSFGAVVTPVVYTIVLAGLAVTFINDGNNQQTDGGNLLTLPTVASEAAAETDGQVASAALLNALVIIGVVTGVTFLMVLLFYFNCNKVITGWLLTSTGLLLLFTTSFMVLTAFQIYAIAWDAISFWFFFGNFAVCGLLAVFYQKGLPTKATQMYLVVVSVVMAWLLLRFLPEWTTLALLLLLACYDLCAVLTPCGPLKLLLKVSEDKEMNLNGLLYEAEVAAPADRRQRRQSAAPSNREEVNANAAGAAGVLGGFIFMSDRTSQSSTSASDTNEDQEREEDGALNAPRIEQVQQQQPELNNSIRLGLGDFVFYSVLCGKAALDSLSAFFAVLVVVIAGLASTLFMLAVFRKALPALPVSIFAGVFFYFIADYLITPMANSLALSYQPL